MKKPSRVRKWFFTIWKLDIDWKDIFNKNKDIIRCVAGQKEKGEKTGKLHWQGFIHMYNPCRLTKIRTLLNLGKGEESADLQVQKGNNRQVLDYVHKIETSQGEKFLFGKPSQQGVRSDLEHIKKLIDDGVSEFDLWQEDAPLMVRYWKGFHRYRTLLQEKKNQEFRQVKVEFLSGPTGCGKTRKGYDIHGYDTNKIYKINCNDLDGFWNGYHGQKNVILDEFANQIKITKLLELLDGYPININVKGSHVPAAFTNVYLTSNLKMCELYPNAKKEHRRALFRRINKITSLWNEVSEGNTVSSSTSFKHRLAELFN